MKDETTSEARGARLRTIREAREETQSAFAERLNETAKALGIEARYNDQGVSFRETGRRALDIEDYTVASYIDPERRSWFWLAFGRELPPANLIPRRVGSKRSAEG
jgi:transcriptional regulator with XRE-family HTH domain